MNKHTIHTLTDFSIPHTCSLTTSAYKQESVESIASFGRLLHILLPERLRIMERRQRRKIDRISSVGLDQGVVRYHYVKGSEKSHEFVIIGNTNCWQDTYREKLLDANAGADSDGTGILAGCRGSLMTTGISRGWGSGACVSAAGSVAGP